MTQVIIFIIVNIVVGLVCFFLGELSTINKLDNIIGVDKLREFIDENIKNKGE